MQQLNTGKQSDPAIRRIGSVMSRCPAARRVAVALTLSLGLAAAGCHSAGRASPLHRTPSSMPAKTTSSPPPTRAPGPTPTTAAPTSTTAAPAPRAPSTAEIAAVMRRTIEINFPSEYFSPNDKPVTIAYRKTCANLP